MMSKIYKLKTTLNKTIKPKRFQAYGKKYYQIHLQIESDTDPKLKNIKNVQYVLHHTFKDRVRESNNRSSKFRQIIRAWGSFRVRVVIRKMDGEEINFDQNMKENWHEEFIKI